MKLCSLVFLLTLILPFTSKAQPLVLDKNNRHYLNYKGKPLLLVTSAEPYGAVINKDFNYELYLKTLHEQGMNYTRIFSGSYVEVPGSFGVENCSLNPPPGAFLAPWMRTSEKGIYAGENKFDLDKWDPAFFKRLKDFVTLASGYDIIVEMTFFCATYEDEYWRRNPFNDQNNINHLGITDRKDFNTRYNKKMLYYQKKLVEKLARELNDFENVFFEISNEPWSDYNEKTTYLHKSLIPEEKYQYIVWARTAPAETLAWQAELAETFRNTERALPKKHLLAQNFADMFESITEVPDNIDILNFHYTWPEAIAANYGWKRPVNYDETGFAGSADSTYLSQAWSFMLSGGAIFNNLDYSFFAGKEDGTGINKAPGGGSTTLRKQLLFLRHFLEGHEFIKMKPAPEDVIHAPGMKYYCLANPGKEYALYFDGRNQGYALLDIPPGKYEVQAYSTNTGQLQQSATVESNGGETRITFPKLPNIAVSLKKK